MKIGSTQFNKEAVKQLSLKEFEALHKHLKIDLRAAYYAITGKKKPKTEKQNNE